MIKFHSQQKPASVKTGSQLALEYGDITLIPSA